MKDDFWLHTFNQMIIYCALNLSLTFNQHGALSASKNIYHCGKISYFFQTFQHVLQFFVTMPIIGNKYVYKNFYSKYLAK